MIRGVRIWSIRKSFSLLNPYINDSRCYFERLSRQVTGRVKMESNSEVYLRIHNDKEQFELSFRYHERSLGVNRQLNFTRNLLEPVSTFLERLSMKVNFSQKKKRNKLKVKSATDENDIAKIAINFLKDGKLVSGDLLCKDLFEGNSNIVLLIGDQEYRILKNHPWVESVALPKSIMAGYPVYPIKLVSLYMNEEESDFSWYRVMNKGSEYLFSGAIYTPSVLDIGHRLKLVCTPKKDGIIGVPIEIVSNSIVEAGPGFCPFETRHEFTKCHLIGDSLVILL